MAVLGVLARLHVPDRHKVVTELAKLDGLTVFSVEEEERLGILIEGPTLETAQATLAAEVNTLPGILGTWPVFAHFEPDGCSASDVLGPQEETQQGVGDEENSP